LSVRPDAEAAGHGGVRLTPSSLSDLDFRKSKHLYFDRLLGYRFEGAKVRVVFSEKSSKDELNRLKAAHQAATDAERKSRTAYYDGSYRNEVVMFCGSAKYAGEASGKVLLKDCESFSWYRSYRRSR